MTMKLLIYFSPHVLMVATRKWNLPQLKCFSKLSLLKEHSLSVDAMLKNISVSSQSCCITWQPMWVSDRRASLRGSSSLRADLRSVRWASSSAWASTGRSASATLPMLRLDILVLELAVCALCCFVHVLLMSSDDLSHDLERSDPAMLTWDMSYLLMCCFSFLSIYFVFDWSNKVRTFTAKVFRQNKANTNTLKYQNIMKAITYLIG